MLFGDCLQRSRGSLDKNFRRRRQPFYRRKAARLHRPSHPQKQQTRLNRRSNCQHRRQIRPTHSANDQRVLQIGDGHYDCPQNQNYYELRSDYGAEFRGSRRVRYARQAAPEQEPLLPAVYAVANPDSSVIHSL